LCKENLVEKKPILASCKCSMKVIEK
jgi:hypothetical protein